MMLIGTLASIGNGTAFPLMIIVFGNMADSFISDAQVKNLWDYLNKELNLTKMYNITEDDVAKNASILT